MTHKTNKTARYLIAVGAAAALLSIAGGSVFAGEITGNGTLKEVHGRSSCAYSGQEDLQFFYDDGGHPAQGDAHQGRPGPRAVVGPDRQGHARLPDDPRSQPRDRVQPEPGDSRRLIPSTTPSAVAPPRPTVLPRPRGHARAS